LAHLLVEAFDIAIRIGAPARFGLLITHRLARFE
jgi:hypothetical protein